MGVPVPGSPIVRLACFTQAGLLFSPEKISPWERIDA